MTIDIKVFGGISIDIGTRLGYCRGSDEIKKKVLAMIDRYDPFEPNDPYNPPSRRKGRIGTSQ